MILFLIEIQNEEVGGKAKGLKRLADLGLRVPATFVVVNPEHSFPDDTELSECLKRLGDGPKAVRSSAISEDGLHASFAGQFESYLNLNSISEISDAITKCVETAHSLRVQSYTSHIDKTADTRISVIVQNMIDAVKAGVIFSANPISNRRDKMLINVTEGIGDELVSGHKDALQYEVFRSGKNIPEQVQKVGNLLSEAEIRELVETARITEQALGFPVDLEWAVDKSGVIQWLQVRPITTLDDVHFNELDTVKGISSDVWSLGNIGEMMPGVVTPLTYSVSAYTIDIGLGYLALRSGAIRKDEYHEFRYLQMFYNRLFFNMTNCMDYVSRILLTQKENVLVSLSAHDVPELIVPPLAPWPVRLINFIRQSYAITRAGRHVGKLSRLEKEFKVELTGNLQRDHFLLTEAISGLAVAFNHHNMASARSGMIYAVIMGILTGNKRKPTHEDHYLGTLLLSDIPGIESADAVKSLEKFAEEIIADELFSNDFSKADVREALTLITEKGPEKYQNLYRDFLSRHGHRCIRESELREKPWEEDPLQLVSMLQSRVNAGRLDKHQNHVDLRIKALLAKLTPAQRFFIKLLHAPARKAVAGRELNKANSMRMLHRIRKAYRQYAENLVAEGLLEDTDQIYFLTHQEIAKLISDRDPEWKQKASKRRILLPESAKLSFDLMNSGIPEPVEETEIPDLPEGAIKGIPVSSGIVRGKARVVNTLEEAGMLEKGEIMVVSYTDIGWTPYFSIIGGLVTEIGSPLSHGAVVAREYGIPAVVSVKGARRAIKSGDFVLLNGNKGTVEIMK